RHRAGDRRGRAGRLLHREGPPVTDVLIFLPLAAAVAIAVVPLDRGSTAWLGMLAALAEVAAAAVAVVRFHVGGGMQFVTDRSWISDFGLGAAVRYHVG